MKVSKPIAVDFSSTIGYNISLIMPEFKDGAITISKEIPAIRAGSIVYPYQPDSKRLPDSVQLVEPLLYENSLVAGPNGPEIEVRHARELRDALSIAKVWKGERCIGLPYFTISPGWKVGWDPNSKENAPEEVERRALEHEQMIERNREERGRARLEVMRRRSFGMQQMSFGEGL